MRQTSINRLPFFIGFRYSFSRRRNRFIGVVSMVSLLGMALGVTSLIVVLSVMNGFADELRGRILSVVPHASIQATSGPLNNWAELVDQVSEHPQVLGAAPYVEAKVLIEGARGIQGAQLLAVDVERESEVSAIAEHMTLGRLEGLGEQRWGIVLGSLLARSLGVTVGDTIELTAPVLTHTPLGTLPRRKRFEVIGTFEIGAQLDGSQALIRLRDGQALMGRGRAVDGVRLAVADLFAAPAVARQLSSSISTDKRIAHWQQTHSSLFSAVKMEKTMITILLLTVVAVAAFNIVSTLTMAVTEKRSDIAVLRTMGAGKQSVMAIFVSQGMFLSFCGVAAGCLVGCVTALNVSAISLFIERLFDVKLFDPRVYFISDLPARLDITDVMLVVTLALVLSLLATLIPAWRAAQVQPAEILRYE